MQIIKVGIEDIFESEYNPRKDLKPGDREYEQLKRSIEEFGYVDPIIVNKNNNKIVGGHQRYKVLKDLGHSEIEVVYIDIDDAHEKALNIALNKISGDWDIEKLEDLLRDINLNTDLDIDLTGWTLEQAETLFSGSLNDIFNTDTQEEKESKKKDKKAEEFKLDVPQRAQFGDIFKLGNHRVMCGDSTSKKCIDKLIDGVVIDFILSDPPYGMKLKTDYTYYNGLCEAKKYKKIAGDGEDFKPELITTFFENFSKVKECFLFGADYFAELIPKRNDGNFLIWEKKKEDQQNVLGSEFETIWSKQHHKRRILRHDWVGFLSSQNNKEARNRMHPSQKPTSLLCDIMKQWGKKATNVLDLYGGCGSTLIACEKMGKSCYMMELDPYYVDVILNRWEEFTGKKAVKLEGGADGTQQE